VFHTALHHARTLGARFATPIWILLLIVSATVFVMRHGAEAIRGLGAIAQSDPRWVIAVLAAQLATIALITMKYRTLFGRLGVRVPPFTMARAYIRRHVIGVVVPFGGPVGLV